MRCAVRDFGLSRATGAVFGTLYDIVVSVHHREHAIDSTGKCPDAQETHLASQEVDYLCGLMHNRGNRHPD